MANKKFIKNREKCLEIKEEQQNLCRFVEIKYEIIEKVNGKYKHLGTQRAKYKYYN